MGINKWILNNISSMEGKTILITGANSGIGYECAKICALKGATIILACRSLTRAENAVQQINKEIPNAKTHILLYDQSSFESIDKFVEELQTKFKKIDVTIANAGIYHPKSLQTTKDGLPLTIGTNYFGVLYLVDKLLPFLEQNNEGKLILVSSLVYRLVNYKNYSFLTNDDINVSKTYGLSKLALTKLFIYLTKKSKLKVYQMHPGVSSTNIFSSINNNYPKWFQKLAHKVLPLFTHSPKKACLGMVALASNDYGNGTFLGPRGLFGISGYPTKKKISKKIYKDVDSFIEYSYDIIKSAIKED